MADNANAFHHEKSDADKAPQTGASAALSVASQEGDASDRGLQTMFEFDPAAGSLKWSDEDAATRIFGVSRDDIATTSDAFSARIYGDEDETRIAAFAGERTSYSCEYQLKRADGDGHWVEERGGWIGAGANRRLISVIRSIESRKRREEQLSWLAVNDELTGHLNRAHLKKALDAKIATMISGGATGAYLMVGIDDLGAVNADFGFEAADKVIAEVAMRLSWPSP